VKDAPIVAAGGLVIRPDPDGALRVLVAHRPRYDDWSLPKGKSDPGEHAEETAAREVEEETGVRAQVIAPLAQVEYRLPSGRHKIVRYFAMRHRDERDFAPNDEVDEIRWLTPGEAAELLSYDHDHTLVASNLHHLMSMGTVWLIRHAAAGDRSTWEGDDTRRPLTKKGHRQAQEIATAIASANRWPGWPSRASRPAYRAPGRRCVAARATGSRGRPCSRAPPGTTPVRLGDDVPPPAARCSGIGNNWGPARPPPRSSTSW
jgi:8-oxo-dGTP pyrophosphatase MutT (NUDIX family)